MFARRPPDSTYVEQQDGKTYSVQVWDTQELPFSADHPQRVRVVRSEETFTQNHYRQRQLQPGTTPHEWLWVTTLEPRAFPTPQVRRLGHDRWKLENNGWNDLTQHWALKHGFLHACRYRPRTISPSGARQPVPNRGLAAVTLILLLAFTLCSAFPAPLQAVSTLPHDGDRGSWPVAPIPLQSCHPASALPIKVPAGSGRTGLARHLHRHRRRLVLLFPFAARRP